MRICYYQVKMLTCNSGVWSEAVLCGVIHMAGSVWSGGATRVSEHIGGFAWTISPESGKSIWSRIIDSLYDL